MKQTQCLEKKYRFKSLYGGEKGVKNLKIMNLLKFIENQSNGKCK
jgi:hypothetical protein